MRKMYFEHITSHKYRVLRAKEELKDDRPSYDTLFRRKRKRATKTVTKPAVKALVKMYLLEDLTGFYKCRYEEDKRNVAEICYRLDNSGLKFFYEQLKTWKICALMSKTAVDLCESRIKLKDYKTVYSSINERALIRVSKGKGRLKLDELMVDIYSRLAKDSNQAKELFDSIIKCERIDLDLDNFKANDDKEQTEPHTDEKSRIDHPLDDLKTVNEMLEMPVIAEDEFDKLFAAIDTVEKFAVDGIMEKQTDENIDPAGIRNAIDGLEKAIEKMRKVAEMFDVNIDDAAECDDAERVIWLIGTKSRFNGYIERLQELKRRIEADADGQDADAD